MQDRNRLTDIENKLVVGYQRREGMGEGQDRGIELTDTNYYI